MARFNAKGIEGLELSLQEFAEIPDSVVEEMLVAGGEVVVEAHKRQIAAMGLVKTGKLRNSIKAVSKAGSVKNGWNRYVLVYPAGQHGQRHCRAVTKTYKRSKHGRTYTVGGDVKDAPNSEVGFIQEYGAPKRRISAKHWMAVANENAGPNVVAAQLAVYDRWLNSLDL